MLNVRRRTNDLPGARRRPGTPRAGRGSQRGFTMLESLITIVILVIGILGLAGLQSRLQAAEMESYQRSQALILLDDMAARLNANRGDAASYVTGATPLGTGDGLDPDCSAVAVGAPRDRCEWSNALKGSTETEGAGGAAIGVMIGARGCVTAVAGAVPAAYQIVVAWQGVSPLVAPAFACGDDDAYGGATYRRAIAKVVAIGTPTPP